MCRGALSAAAFLAASCLAAQSAADVEQWLRQVDATRNAFSEAVITARASQLEDGKVAGSADFDVYAKGREKALLVFRGGKNAGRKILTVGERMWLIVPGTQNPVPITPNQRLMGGASFGDVARLRFADDFTATARPGTERVGDHECRVLDLVAKSPKAPYPRVTLWLDAGNERLPRKLAFFLPSGKPAREAYFTKFGRTQGKTVVEEMEIRDLLAPQSKAVTRLEYLQYRPAEIADSIFTPDGAKAM